LSNAFDYPKKSYQSEARLNLIMTLNHFKKFNPKGKNSNGSETQCSVAVTEHDYNDK